FAARPVASLVAGRPRLRQRGDHARGGGAGASVSLEAAADRQRQAHDREARLDARTNGAGAAIRRTILPVAGSRRGCLRSFTTGGTSSSGSPIPASIARRSPAVPCS